MHYRRDYTAGATYFFTVVTFGRRKLFNHPETVAQLRLAFSGEMARRPFHIDAIVIMPDHLHTIWTLPTEDLDYSIRWRNVNGVKPCFLPWRSSLIHNFGINGVKLD